jgi:hypothetical protein
MVQDCEAQQMAELTDFLEAEMEFVQSYYEILSELKSDWERRCVLRGSGRDPPLLTPTFSLAVDQLRLLDRDRNQRLRSSKRSQPFPVERRRLRDSVACWAGVDRLFLRSKTARSRLRMRTPTETLAETEIERSQTPVQAVKRRRCLPLSPSLAR